MDDLIYTAKLEDELREEEKNEYERIYGKSRK